MSDERIVIEEKHLPVLMRCPFCDGEASITFDAPDRVTLGCDHDDCIAWNIATDSLANVPDLAAAWNGRCSRRWHAAESTIDKLCGLLQGVREELAAYRNRGVPS